MLPDFLSSTKELSPIMITWGVHPKLLDTRFNYYSLSTKFMKVYLLVRASDHMLKKNTLKIN